MFVASTRVINILSANIQKIDSNTHLAKHEAKRPLCASNIQNAKGRSTQLIDNVTHEVAPPAPARGGDVRSS